MATDTSHGSVGAYVLGVLEADGMTAFEEHLAECDVCAAEVEGLLPTALMLADVSPNQAIVLHVIQSPDVPEVAPKERVGPSDLVRRAVARTSALHRRQRPTPRHGQSVATGLSRRTAVLTGAAATVLAVVAFTAGNVFAGGGTDPVAQGGPPPSPSAAAGLSTSSIQVVPSERFDVNDPRTGVHAIMSVTEASWGSQISLTLGGVRGPLRCDLVAVGTDGVSTVVASWSVHAPGYGIPEDPEVLTVEATTVIGLHDTRNYVIRATAPDGTRSTLVTMPV
jgi:anti-sigma factor RsiW